MKSVFLHGLLAALGAALSSYVYHEAYSFALLVDFSSVINAGKIIGACLFGTTLASLGYFYWNRWVKKWTDLSFNLLFSLLTCASFYGVFATPLPLDIESPELFIGLALPMHLFPQMFWMAFKPLFGYSPS